jgi:UDP:flavonoid glycosyltransferase YjiC (YdhE family)
VRALFTCRPLFGHYEPAAALARAAAAAGHDVAFATAEPVASAARAAGFQTFAAGPDAGWRPPGERPFREREQGPELERRIAFFRRLFVETELEPRARELERVLAGWRPDLVVRDLAELASPVVAAAARVPCATVGYGALLPAELLAATAAAAVPHWRARGLDPPGDGGLYGELYLDTWPPSLQPPGAARPAQIQPLRTAAAAAPADRAGEGFAPQTGRPLVYVTLGTAWGWRTDVLCAVLDALAEEELEIVVTVGEENDPAALGPPRPHVRVERFIRQSLVLPHADLVIAHGGAGSVLGALASACPLLLLPLGADNFVNAERVAAAGAGQRLLPAEVSAGAIRAGVRALLGEPRYRAAADAIAAEIAAMPDAAEAVRALERLTRERPPGPGSAG